jgi:hypothetical protein
VGLSGHQSARMLSADWLTPPEILARLGPFDLDPCTPETMPWTTAAARYTKLQDGLVQAWRGRVWLNPPFGREAPLWLAKLRRHGNGIALVPARTETRMFYENVWGHADAVCFLRGRPHFHRPDGTRAAANSGAPICLVAYGYNNAAALRSADLGFVVPAKMPHDQAVACARCNGLRISKFYSPFLSREEG